MKGLIASAKGSIASGEEIDSIREGIDCIGEGIDSIREEIDCIGEEIDSFREEIDCKNGSVGSWLNLKALRAEVSAGIRVLSAHSPLMLN